MLTAPFRAVMIVYDDRLLRWPDHQVKQHGTSAADIEAPFVAQRLRHELNDQVVADLKATKTLVSLGSSGSGSAGAVHYRHSVTRCGR